ncbi:hypothetical protein RHSIM_Rhsim11G0009600 [Rhododendron simsii]|uniref:Uncharacterized protein n=1 Tax=Rhododendron simsii TaxID=118357 RepID=A0A834GB01_RHOSS|nr:hypothetical protein RHSIM_Rhsim11G0009600 [Rhododendron simsii]
MWIKNFCEPDKMMTNLTNYLRQFELWVLGYQKVCTDEMGAYMPRNAIQRSALEDLLALKNAVQDRIVQEVLYMILEPIYKARFSQKSFAFRLGRNDLTVLRVVRRSFAGYLWYIKGDLSTILDGMKVGMVISALMRDVRDKKVIDLIKSALVKPVITTPHGEGEKKKKTKRKYQKKRVLAEDEPKPDPYWLDTFFGFAPEEAEKLPSWGNCGILSPLLANVCIDELDRWMEDKIKKIYCPSKRDVIENNPVGEAEQGNTSWPEFVPTSGPDKTRKIDYVRYGGHILIGIRGPRVDVATLRKQLIEFCDKKYLLKLDNESLLVEHITKGLMYTGMSLVPETDYSPFPNGWRPEHEKALLEYIRLDDPKILEEHRSALREQGLLSPQDYVSMLVWNYKRNAIGLDQLPVTVSHGNNVESVESNPKNDDEMKRSEGDQEERHQAAQM